ncbi:MAG: hypothetical protein DME89_13715 [Verrucomicrobia bacterium]|nr:MAG: hypothetical protein DME89_13715 [Verrucomicrobiota bacterium]
MASPRSSVEADGAPSSALLLGIITPNQSDAKTPHTPKALRAKISAARARIPPLTRHSSLIARYFNAKVAAPESVAAAASVQTSVSV